MCLYPTLSPKLVLSAKPRVDPPDQLQAEPLIVLNVRCGARCGSHAPNFRNPSSTRTGRGRLALEGEDQRGLNARHFVLYTTDARCHVFTL